MEETRAAKRARKWSTMRDIPILRPMEVVLEQYVIHFHSAPAAYKWEK